MSNFFTEFRLLHQKLYKQKEELDLAYKNFSITYEEIKESWLKFPDKKDYDKLWYELEKKE